MNQTTKNTIKTSTLARQLVLASTSPYRREILDKLGVNYTTIRPDFDETPQYGEKPQDLVKRLALGKAQSVASTTNNALIIGSDQVCCIDDDILGKPHTESRAIEQLTSASGKKVTFYTGLSLYDAQNQSHQTCCVVYHVHFKFLSKEAIKRYIEKEQPLDCAGSFKSEGYGITLFERLEGEDPNTLIGLPLIELIRMLEKHEIELP